MRFGQEWRPTNLGTLLRAALDQHQQPKDLNVQTQRESEVPVRESPLRREHQREV
jgi:hypothetical protein